MNMETSVPPEIRAEAEKSFARSRVKDGLESLINRRMEQGPGVDAKAKILSAEEERELRGEVKRLGSMQEVWNKLDRGDSLSPEDKQAIQETVQAWQSEIAQELQQKFEEKKKIDMDRLAGLEKQQQERAKVFEGGKFDNIARGIRMDQETLAVLKDMTAAQGEINVLRKKRDGSDTAIDGLRNALEKSQSVLDSVESI